MEVINENKTLDVTLDTVFGTGIVRMEQTTTSDQDGGTNVWTAYLSNGQSFNFEVKNGKDVKVTDEKMTLSMQDLQNQINTKESTADAAEKFNDLDDSKLGKTETISNTWIDGNLI